MQPPAPLAPESPPARLRVLIDAAPLGFGVTPGIGRAGIFRATEGFVLEALRHTDLEIDVGALEAYLAEIQLRRYDRLNGGALAGRRVSFWRHPTVEREDTTSLVDRIAGLGEAAPAAAKLMAELALTNRLARPADRTTTYDVYHSLRPPLAARTRVSARARALTVHDVVPLMFPEWCDERAGGWMRAALASLDRDRDWIICYSRQVQLDTAEHAGIDPSRMFVVPLAADSAIFHPVRDPTRLADVRRRYGLGDRPYLLSLGTIEPRKNLAHLVRCVARLVEQPGHADLQLVLVGAMGWKTQPIMDALASAAIRDRLHVTGFVADADLAPLYAGADVFVYPSHYEGFGLPVLEAMQCGVPVVTTTGGALPEVAGDAALLVDPADADGLVDAITAARRNAALAARGVERAGHFRWARSVGLTVDAYRAMLARS
ncbi:MAG: glycosyltransferase family 4 protein [Acidobacteria bacterium]|nr:glycosyltransferase family 4 protein [Acidobacteriota bacterium]